MGELDDLRNRRREREANARSALDRGLIDLYSAPGLIRVSRADEDTTLCDRCDIAAFRPPLAGRGAIALIGSTPEVSVALSLNVEHLRTLLRLVEGKRVRPEKLAALRVSIFDLDDENDGPFRAEDLEDR
jgi:hypothetical protein